MTYTCPLCDTGPPCVFLDTQGEINDDALSYKYFSLHSPYLFPVHSRFSVFPRVEGKITVKPKANFPIALWILWYEKILSKTKFISLLKWIVFERSNWHVPWAVICPQSFCWDWGICIFKPQNCDRPSHPQKIGWKTDGVSLLFQISVRTEKGRAEEQNTVLMGWGNERDLSTRQNFWDIWWSKILMTEIAVCTLN